jgi:hypothetical protein
VTRERAPSWRSSPTSGSRSLGRSARFSGLRLRGT